MYARLTVVSGSPTPHVDLRLPTIIGRGSAASLKLPSSTVSRTHCEVYEYDGQIAIRDLDSANGTIVNGHRIDCPTFITPEDEVMVGPVRFRLSVVSPTAHPPSTDPQQAAETLSTLEKIASASAVPQRAEETGGDDEGQAFAPDGTPEGTGSSLHYVESEAEGERSFVGIVTEDRPAEDVSESPHIEVEHTDPSGVLEDDSSLRSFFDNLEG